MPLFIFVTFKMFVIVITDTSEDVCCSIRNVKLIQKNILVHALSIDNACNRRLFSFASSIISSAIKRVCRLSFLFF